MTENDVHESFASAMKNWGGWLRVVISLLGFSIFWSWQVSQYTATTDNRLTRIVDKLDATNSDLSKIASATQTAIQQLAEQQTKIAVEMQKNIAQDNEMTDIKNSLRDTIRALDGLRSMPMRPR